MSIPLSLVQLAPGPAGARALGARERLSLPSWQRRFRLRAARGAEGWARASGAPAVCAAVESEA